MAMTSTLRVVVDGSPAAMRHTPTPRAASTGAYAEQGGGGDVLGGMALGRLGPQRGEGRSRRSPTTHRRSGHEPVANERSAAW